MTKQRVTVVVAGIAVLLLALTGCLGAPRPQEPFRPAVSDYVQRLRWQDYHGVARYLAEEHREAFLERFLPLSDLRITDVRLDSVEPQAEKDRMVTHIVLEYYLLPSATVKRVALRQEWIHLPSFGWRSFTPLPSLQEGG